jgi:hypothetical protein
MRIFWNYKKAFMGKQFFYDRRSPVDFANHPASSHCTSRLDRNNLRISISLDIERLL